MRTLLATIICLSLFAVAVQAEPVIQFYFSKMSGDLAYPYGEAMPPEYGDGTILTAAPGETVYLWARTLYVDSGQQWAPWNNISLYFTGDVSSGEMYTDVWCCCYAKCFTYRWEGWSDSDPAMDDNGSDGYDDIYLARGGETGIGAYGMDGWCSWEEQDGDWYGHFCLGEMAWGTLGYQWIFNDTGLTLRNDYATSELYFGFNPDGTMEYAGPGEVAHTTSTWGDIFIGAEPPGGDLNCDGSINSLDIDPFILVLTEDCTAYYLEYPYCSCMLADANNDGSNNALDIDPFVDLLMYNDCNGNGVPDDSDIAHGTSEDLDRNGLPDECQQQLYVNRVPNEFATIQSAIDHAQIAFEVLVADGVYTGSGNKNLDFAGKTITVRSENGPSNCIIDCENSGRGFYFHSGEIAVAVVDGFTIRKGYVGAGSPKGGGIHCDAASPTITNCILAENTANKTGGAIYLSSSAATVTNCLFISNESLGSHGGGMFCTNSSSPIVTNCTFVDNLAGTEDMAGGLFSGGSTVADLDNCIFWGNSARNGNQLAAGSSGVLNVSYCDVEGGSAGIYLNGGSFNWLTGNIETDPLFADPASDDYHLSVGSPCIDTGDPGGDYTGQTDIDGEPRVINERVDMGADEYVYNADAPVIHLAPTSFAFFTKEGDPSPPDQVLSIGNFGAVTLHWQVTPDCGWCQAIPSSGETEMGEFDDVLVRVDSTGFLAGEYNCTLSVADPNAVNSPRVAEVTLSVVGVELHVPAEYDTIQAAINASVDGCTVVVADGTYTGSGNKNLDFGGKAITVKSENGPYSCIIDCNSSNRGFYFHSGETAAAVVNGFTIREGLVYYIPQSGAGIYCNGSSPTIRNCIIADNEAFGAGGGIYVNNSMATVTNCLLIGNESRDSHGGGMFCTNSSNPTVSNCTFVDNVADDRAGGLFSGGSGTTVQLTNCIFWGNSAPNGKQLAAANDGILNVSYCDVQNGSAGVFLAGGTLNWLTGNIGTDPLFVDPPSDDYHLSAGSPCIDAGDPGGDYTGQTDIDGEPRVMNGLVDMGADEFLTVMSGDSN